MHLRGAVELRCPECGWKIEPGGVVPACRFSPRQKAKINTKLNVIVFALVGIAMVWLAMFEYSVDGMTRHFWFSAVCAVICGSMLAVSCWWGGSDVGSGGLHIVLEKSIPDFESFANSSTLIVVEDQLDRLANDLGVAPLMDFDEGNLAKLEAALNSQTDHEDLDPSLLEVRWFRVSEGLVTIRALIGHLESSKTLGDEREAALKDLREFESVLEKASQADVRWHFSMD